MVTRFSHDDVDLFGFLQITNKHFYRAIYLSLLISRILHLFLLKFNYLQNASIVFIGRCYCLNLTYDAKGRITNYLNNRGAFIKRNKQTFKRFKWLLRCYLFRIKTLSKKNSYIRPSCWWRIVWYQWLLNIVFKESISFK